MNCSVCGSPLLFDRVVFHCECGAYVHSYCADKHIVESHRPAMEEGHADLNGDFHLKYQPESETIAVVEAAAVSDAPRGEDEGEVDLGLDEGIAGDVGEELEGASGDDQGGDVSDEENNDED